MARSSMSKILEEVKLLLSVLGALVLGIFNFDDRGKGTTRPLKVRGSHGARSSPFVICKLFRYFHSYNGKL